MVKKIFSVVFCVCILLSFSSNVKAISAQSAIVIDLRTNTIIYEYNAYEKMSMASTTKLMTALLASEYILENNDEIVTITEEMCMVEGSSMGLQIGDKVSISSLIIGLLLPSGNDAANAIALYIAEDFDSFATLMNNRANEIGMFDTNFVTPSGLDADGHQSTVYDMALLMCECLKNENISFVLGSQSLSVSYSSIEEEEVTVTYTNHNKLLWYYEYCTGGKTGYTSQSGRCLVTSASKNSYELVCVTFNAPDDWNDHIALYELSYEQMYSVNFEGVEVNIPLTAGGTVDIDIKEEEIYSISGENIEQKIYLPRFFYSSSLLNGDVLGYVRYYEDGILILENEIIY